MINIQNKQFIEVSDLNKLVEETYGRTYHFQQQDGCKSRGIHQFSVPDDEVYDYENDRVPEEVNHREMGVSFKAWLERDPKQLLETDDEWDRKNGLEMWWQRNFYPEFQMVANDLYNKGLLPEGEYIINIDW